MGMGWAVGLEIGVEGSDSIPCSPLFKMSRFKVESRHVYFE